MREYAVSRETTKQLRIKIQAQQHNYNIDTVKQKEVEAKLKKERATYEKKELERIREQMSKEELRANDISQMKGGSSWLTTLPLQINASFLMLSHCDTAGKSKDYQFTVHAILIRINLMLIMP